MTCARVKSPLAILTVHLALKPVNGSCLCGAVGFEVNADPIMGVLRNDGKFLIIPFIRWSLLSQVFAVGARIP